MKYISSLTVRPSVLLFSASSVSCRLTSLGSVSFTTFRMLSALWSGLNVSMRPWHDGTSMYLLCQTPLSVSCLGVRLPYSTDTLVRVQSSDISPIYNSVSLPDTSAKHDW